MRMPRLPQNPIVTALVNIARGVDHIIRDLHAAKEAIVTSKEEVLAQIADVRNLLVETGEDVRRVADKLDAAVAAGDLSDVSAAVAELRGLAQGIDDRAEQSDPEQVDSGDEPTEPVEQ